MPKTYTPTYPSYLPTATGAGFRTQVNTTKDELYTAINDIEAHHEAGFDECFGRGIIEGYTVTGVATATFTVAAGTNEALIGRYVSNAAGVTGGVVVGDGTNYVYLQQDETLLISASAVVPSDAILIATGIAVAGLITVITQVDVNYHLGITHWQYHVGEFLFGPDNAHSSAFDSSAYFGGLA